jgi:hypothetical protein
MILVVPGGYGGDEYDNLMEDYGQCSQALQDFLDKKIDFDEYTDILKERDIDMDSYLTTVENNFEYFELV